MSAFVPLGPRGRRAFLAAAAGSVAAGLAGCYVPTPTSHAQLRVGADGRFAFNGRSVADAELATALASARKPAADGLVVVIIPAPGSPVARVREAVAAVERAHARVAFGGPA